MNKLLRTILTVIAVISVLAAADPSAAKSLYVITDQDTYSPPTPINAYLINADGSLTYQAQHQIPGITGAVGLAIDTASATLFMSVESLKGAFEVIDALTMTDLGSATAPDAQNLAGVVMDEKKALLYVIDRSSANLYVYQWDRAAKTLTAVTGSPFTLPTPTNYSAPNAFGIALDTVNNLLYVANDTKDVYVYNTGNWSLAGAGVVSITTPAVISVISVAFDSANQLLYTGDGFGSDPLLVQKNMAGGAENTVDVSNGQSGFGVMGLGVDNATGDVYLTTGNAMNSGGDLVAYNKSLTLIQRVPDIGPAPVGLAIPTSGSIQYINGLVVNFGASGLWYYRNGTWRELTWLSPGKMATYGSDIVALFQGAGLYQYDGAAWTHLTSLSSIDLIVGMPDRVYVDFTGAGLWQYNGSWTQITPLNPNKMIAFGNTLLANFPGAGLFQYDGINWTQLTPLDSADSMVAGPTTAYVDFPSFGLYAYSIGAWTGLTSLNSSMTLMYGNDLLAKFAGYGLYSYNGASWTQLTPFAPQGLLEISTNLYVNFGNLGVYKYNGAWTEATPLTPNLMGSMGSSLIANFSGYGLYAYDGSAWSRLTPLGSATATIEASWP